MAVIIAIGLAISTGNILYGIAAGFIWGFFADSLIGILIALAAIGSLGALFGIAS